MLQGNGGLITSRTQDTVQLEIRKIAVRDLSKARDGDAPADLFTTNLLDVVNDDAVDVVVELIGGTDAAYDLVEAALKAGKPVVTGNKALLAERGGPLFGGWRVRLDRACAGQRSERSDESEREAQRSAV